MRRVTGQSVLALAVAATLLTSCGQTIRRAAPISTCPTNAPCPIFVSPSGVSPPPASPAIVISPSFSRPPKNQSSPSPRTSPRPLIAVIVMENHEYESIIGSSCCPFINSLVGQGMLFTNYHAVAHPSLPNYLAMTSGGTNGKGGTDSITAGEINVENVFQQLSKAGLTWNAYQESMPSPCYKGTTAGNAPFAYALKHDPAMTYGSIANTSLCNRVVPATGISLLPDFSFITPNLCYDMHSCPAGSGDTWLRANVGALVSALGPTGRVILTWDEGTTGAGGGGHVVALELGPGVPVGRDPTPFDHYSLLAGIESTFGLPRLQKAAGATPLPLFAGKA
jgi:phosphatidylinositol-3-phosphatase